ncbi:hypothetical protein HKX48_006310 [Thoreauomyces humboldtii]|nr:hypothetical protein HKX48_006310 [Thoreauomyces humboldtii]
MLVRHTSTATPLRPSLPASTSTTANAPSPLEFDVLCVGFGPAGLAIGAAMADRGVITAQGMSQTIDDSISSSGSNNRLDVHFVERQQSFQWHGGMLIDNTRMQIPFVKDLSSLRDPSSSFTFLRYLKEKDRLVAFLNLGCWNPYRVEFNDYLRWAAEKLAANCSYGERVESVEPVLSRPGVAVNKVRIVSVDDRTGERIVRVSKTVVVAIGGQPSYPDFYHRYVSGRDHGETTERAIHTAHYKWKTPTMLPDAAAPYHLVVVGGGQSAAEVFVDLGRRYPNATVTLVFRSSALRPSDASPFVNEIFNPEARDEFYNRSHEQRRASIRADLATNYSVVNEKLIEDIYAMMYRQGLPGAEKNPQHVLLPHHEIRAMRDADGGIALDLADTFVDSSATVTHTYDAVFFGSGYARSAHLDMLRPLAPYLKRDSVTDNLVVGRDYRVATTEGFTAGVYVQGCCEETHGLSDTLLSVLGVRGGEILYSIQNHLTTVDTVSASTKRSALKIDHRDIGFASPPPSPTSNPFHLVHTAAASNASSYSSFASDRNIGTEPSDVHSDTRDASSSSSSSNDNEEDDDDVDRNSNPPSDNPVPVNRTPNSFPLHPLPPSKPLPGTILFSKYIPAFHETFTLRVASFSDVPRLTRWHNQPRVAEFWNELGDESHHHAYLTTLLCTPHSIPCIGEFDGTAFSYFEIYWAAWDNIGRYYSALPDDRGFHLLVGEETYRGPHRVEAWMEAVLEFMWTDCEKTERIVLEPRSDNAKMVGYLGNHGFKFSGELALKHKKAAFMVLERKDVAGLTRKPQLVLSAK